MTLENLAPDKFDQDFEILADHWQISNHSLAIMILANNFEI